MSWLTGLAGKAEELLNKVDQTANASLNISTISEEGSAIPVPGNKKSPLTVSPPDPARTPTPPITVQTKPSSIGKKSSKKTLDDELFDFLNSEPTKEVKKKLVHSRQSSTGSARTTDSGLQFTARPHTPADDANHSPTDRNSGSSACPSDYELIENPPAMTVSEEMTASAMSTHSMGLPSDAAAAADADVKSLELENGLLKSEIQSLNSEVTSLLQRVRQAESELSVFKTKSDSQDQQISKLEQMLRELRDRETDQVEELNAKNSQVAILRVRLEELEGEVKSKSSRLDELEQDRERILRDHSDSSGLHSQALDSLKIKLAEAESKLKLDQENAQKSQREYSERQSRLEVDQQTLSETVVQLQKKLSDEKHRTETLSQQLKHSRINMESAKQELSDYKEKAARILQSKDKLISSMKECGVEGVDGELSSDINAEMEQEKIMLRQELQQSSALVESLRMEVQDLETQLQADHDESRQTIDNLEDKLSQTQSRYSGLEQELRQKDEEMKYTQEQSVLQKTTLQQQITDRDVEIDKLRNQVMSKKLSTASESELETRLHQLTENLIEKQTLVESLSTEKNSLRLQLERSEQQCKQLERTEHQNTASTTVFVGEEDGMRHRPNLPSFLKESPTDPEFARKVKRAANTIDRFSIRLGVFLRRYPIARVFVIIYMLLLHLWTMIVLLTYQPEMHGSEHSHMPVPLDHVPKDLPT